jgi:glycosyltransferase involved in cell wall biosynthesis
MSEKKKQTITLCMIVKNEAHIITDTLKSITPYINYYVINDTGSTDNTIHVIKDYFDSVKIDGIIVQHDFRTCAKSCHDKEWKRYSEFHFGWNRTYSLNLCRGKSDYIWVTDADDIIKGNLNLPELTEDAYLLKIGNDFTFNRMHIFKNDPSFNWKYVGALHEYADADKPISSKLIKGDYWIETNTNRIGERSSAINKYLLNKII